MGRLTQGKKEPQKRKIESAAREARMKANADELGKKMKTYIADQDKKPIDLDDFLELESVITFTGDVYKVLDVSSGATTTYNKDGSVCLGGDIKVEVTEEAQSF